MLPRLLLVTLLVAGTPCAAFYPYMFRKPLDKRQKEPPQPQKPPSRKVAPPSRASNSPRPVQPIGWVHNELDNVMYRAFPTKLTFSKARTFCQKKGGDLITTLSSQSRIDMLKILLVPDVSYWIGVQRDVITFVDGTVVGKFRPLGVGEPKGTHTEVRCMEMKNGKWYEKTCSTKKNFICQIALAD